MSTVMLTSSDIELYLLSYRSLIVYTGGFSASELRELLAVAVEHSEIIREYWNEHLG